MSRPHAAEIQYTSCRKFLSSFVLDAEEVQDSPLRQLACQTGMSLRRRKSRKIVRDRRSGHSIGRQAKLDGEAVAKPVTAAAVH